MLSQGAVRFALAPKRLTQWSLASRNLYTYTFKGIVHANQHRASGRGTRFWIHFVSTFDEVVQLIHERFGVERGILDPTATLTEFGLDSLTLVELIFAIEEHFGIQIPDPADIKNLKGLATLIDGLGEVQSSYSLSHAANG